MGLIPMSPYTGLAFVVLLSSYVTTARAVMRYLMTKLSPALLKALSSPSVFQRGAVGLRAFGVTLACLLQAKTL